MATLFPGSHTHPLHPITYWSSKIQPTEHNYKIHNKVLLAVVDPLQAWPHYLHRLHHNFEVITDHHALQYFQTKCQLNCHQAQWSQTLHEFIFSITYQLGAQATCPDALSCQSDHHPNADTTTTHTDPDNLHVLLPITLFANLAMLQAP